MEAFYGLSKEEVLQQLQTMLSSLDNERVPALQQQFGQNVLKESKQKSRLAILLAQLTDVVIFILVVAAVISFIVGGHTDAYVILAIIIGNAWMGYSQEYNAEQSVRMLQKMAAQYATVIRSDNPKKIEAGQLVPMQG